MEELESIWGKWRDLKMWFEIGEQQKAIDECTA